MIMTDDEKHEKPYLFRGVKGQKAGTKARIFTINHRLNQDHRILIQISEDWVIRTNGKIQTTLDKITDDRGKISCNQYHINDADRTFTQGNWEVAFTMDEPVEDQIEWVIEQTDLVDDHKIMEYKARSKASPALFGHWDRMINQIREHRRNAPHPHISWTIQNGAHHYDLQNGGQ